MNKKIFSYAIILPLILSSCEGIFDPKEVGEVNDDVMWTIPEMVQGVLYQSYNAIPSRADTYDSNFLDVATDNAVTSSIGTGIHRIALGQYTAQSCPLSVWNSAYEQIQNINLFLEKGLTENTQFDTDAAQDELTKKQLRAEALYLRAWWSARLLKYHGGVTADGEALGYVILDRFIEPEKAADFSWIRRNTYEECVEAICNDCDEAAEVLPLRAEGDYYGRATALMAQFLKARVLFLAACPAYQPKEIVRLNNGYDYEIVDDTAYKDKWKRAAIQAALVIEMSGVTSYPALAAKDIVDFAADPKTPAHFVSRYYFSSNNLESRHFPSYYYGQALTTPSQNLVDAYPMITNGFPIDDAAESGYDPANPYADRDARLAATIYCHGDIFGDSGEAIDVIAGHKDSEGFISNVSGGSRTGYYLRKHLSSKSSMLEPLATSAAAHLYPAMRIAEMYLDYAEASNEVWGPTAVGTLDGGITVPGSAYDIIRQVRKTSGKIKSDEYIETVKDDADSFRKLILNERRLEFAFEDCRFWDLRRRLLPLDETVRGVVVTESGEAVSYSYRDVEKRDMASVGHYYLPIPYNEMKKNSNMVNNIGY